MKTSWARRGQHAVLAGALLLEVLAGCSRKEKAWKPFSPEAGKFSVAFPGTPKESTKPLSTSWGVLEMHGFVVEVDSQAAYGVTYIDYPAKEDLTDSTNFLNRVQTAVLGDKGKLSFQQDLRVENHPAREFEYEGGGKANYSGRIRLILVDHRLYEVIAIFLTANPHPAERQKFFDSFSLGGK